jgi:hypothetical protein
VTFTKVLQDGRTATVTPSGRQRCTVEIGGAYFTDGEIRELPSPRGPATHVIGHGKMIGLTAAEAAAITADIAAASAAFDASPEGQRSALAITLAMASGEWESAREHAADTGEWARVVPAETAMNEAQDALDAFDAAHPALTAKIAAKRTGRERENFEAGWNR